MLVLSRKIGERIRIGDNVTLTVVRVQGDKVRLGVEAPSDVSIHREEVHRSSRRIGSTGPSPSNRPCRKVGSGVRVGARRRRDGPIGCARGQLLAGPARVGLRREDRRDVHHRPDPGPPRNRPGLPALHRPALRRHPARGPRRLLVPRMRRPAGRRLRLGPPAGPRVALGVRVGSGRAAATRCASPASGGSASSCPSPRPRPW